MSGSEVYAVLGMTGGRGYFFEITDSLLRAQQAAANVQGIVVKLLILEDHREGQRVQ